MADAADFRRIALSFKGAGEYPHFDRRAFKARVTFATLAPDELSANIKFAPDEQALKCAVAPDAFAALDNAWGRRGWTAATLAALSEAELGRRWKWPGAMRRRRRSASGAAAPKCSINGRLFMEDVKAMRKPIVVPPEEGRDYPMGQIRAVFQG